MTAHSSVRFQNRTGLDPIWWLQAALIVSVLCIGLSSALVGIRINGDGVSYVEIAETYVRGDWGGAVNAYWSPLYSWVLAAVFAAYWPPAPWEYFFVELVNFLIFCLAFLAYCYFLRRTSEFRRLYLVDTQRRDDRFEHILRVVGFCLFAWVSIEWIEVRLVTPDWCVAALVFLASGLLLRMATRPHVSGTIAFLFGVVIAAAYLAKAAMLILGLGFLATLPFLGGERGQIIRRVALAFAGFIVIAGPWISVLSLSKGYLTYGDAGTLNYAWYVNGSAENKHWQGEHRGAGEPLHPTRQLHDDPSVFEFASPIQGTYPPWYDPSYWNEGLKTTFNLQEQLNTVVSHLRQYVSTAYRVAIVPLFALVVFVLYSRPLRRFARNVFAYWPLLLPSAAAFVLYALVHVELRFLGAFGLIILTVAFASTEPEKGYLAKWVLTVMLALLILAGPLRPGYLSGEAREDVGALLGGTLEYDPYRGISDGMTGIGIRPGDTIAVVGAKSSAAVWARRARVKIIAEIPSYEGKHFWASDIDSRRKVLKLFSALNVSAVVATEAPDVLPREEGWMRVSNSNLFAIPGRKLP